MATHESEQPPFGAQLQGSSIKIIYGPTYEQRVIDMKKQTHSHSYGA